MEVGCGRCGLGRDCGDQWHLLLRISAGYIGRHSIIRLGAYDLTTREHGRLAMGLRGAHGEIEALSALPRAFLIRHDRGVFRIVSVARHRPLLYR